MAYLILESRMIDINKSITFLWNIGKKYDEIISAKETYNILLLINLTNLFM